MNRTPRNLAAAVVVLAILLGGSACGSSDEPDTSSTTEAGVTTTVVDAAGGTEATADTSAATDDEVAAGSGECVADPSEPSGSSTVTWSDGEATPELTLTFTEDGSLEPSALTVNVGQRFLVDHGPGSDIRVVKIGCAGGQTIPAGVTAGFVITAPGEYAIVDEAADGYAGAEVGTVTVTIGSD